MQLLLRHCHLAFDVHRGSLVVTGFGFGKVCVAGHDGLLHRLGEIVLQVPTVGDLQ
jgi:hypothetical protein